MVLSVIVAGFSQVLLKQASQKTYKNIYKEYLNINVILGYVLLFVSTILTIIAFKGISYTSGPILESLGYVFVMLLSLLFFNEKITKYKILGNILIIAGIIVFYV